MFYEETLLYGRYIVCEKEDIQQLPVNVKVVPAILEKRCGRCQSKILKKWQLPNNMSYCWICAKMGRITSNNYLVTMEEPNNFKNNENPCIWEGKLTKLQQTISDQQLTALSTKTSHLTYAVTGAGKTEMLFPMLTQAIIDNMRIAVVAPRIDVVIELQKRIQAAFNIPFVTLYGGSKDEYKYTQLVIATTHQLMGFKEAFDVIVLDEADAFPYAGNEVLEHVTKQALKKTGICFYLTATLNQQLKRLVQKNEIAFSTLPKRFHGYALPNITIKFIYNWRLKLPSKIIRHVRRLKKLQIKFLLFVPEVTDVEMIVSKLRKVDINVLGTYAADEKRLEKVQLMRDEKIDGLVTTTILERGVTFKGIDVLILGGDEKIFTAPTIIQIAGRCGRSIERPTGTVTAYVREKTKQLNIAIAEINYLNVLGKKYDM
ncbi:competence protein ComFA [Weissella bombi]|uniref:Competence protein ComFA n=2 Tax=Weissella bombi TaxID=1505725 RepID=A0A1C4AYC0_9LACO|nr:competence protein ComFA [Weissella bombi]